MLVYDLRYVGEISVAKIEKEKEEAVAKRERQLREEGYGGGVYNQKECPICLDGIYSQHFSILPCYHLFHTTCWMSTSRRSCPVCRAGYIDKPSSPNTFGREYTRDGVTTLTTS